MNIFTGMMLNSIFRVLVRTRVPYPNLRNVKFSPFSSKSLSETSNKSSFASNYLISKFGFTEERALAVSNRVKFSSLDKPELVLAFLKDRGLTADQIRCTVRYCPLVLLSDPYKTFVPKIEFFLSSGISQNEVNNIFLEAPVIFLCSLENQIKPSFSFIESLFNASGTSLTSMKGLGPVFSSNLGSCLIPNIEILRDAGVPDSRIVKLLQLRSRVLTVETEKFREVVKEVKQMNFDPYKSNFTMAIVIIRSMSKLIWEKKVSVYKEWGLSEDDILLAFQRQPCFMRSSIDKITAVMHFVVNEMWCDSSLVVKMPNIVLLSLEKRLKPRYSVYKLLVANGLIKKGSFLYSVFSIPEIEFLRKFVQLYENDVPGLLECYQKNRAISEI